MIQINSSTQLSFNGEEFVIIQNKVDYIEEIYLNIIDAQTLIYEIEQIIRCNKALMNIK